MKTEVFSDSGFEAITTASATATVLLDKAGELGLDLPHVAVGLQLINLAGTIQESGAMSAYAAILPPREHENPELSIVVEFPDELIDEAESIRKLDTIAGDDPLQILRVGEPVDFGLGRIRGARLEQALEESYDGAFVQIYPNQEVNTPSFISKIRGAFT